MRTKFLFIVNLLISQFATAVTTDADDIRIMFHGGHDVINYCITFDERYIITRGEHEVCVWDLRNMMLLNVLPISTMLVEPHEADSKLIYVKLKDIGSYSATHMPNYKLVDWTDGSTVAYLNSGGPDFYGVSDYEVILTKGVAALSHGNTIIGYIGNAHIDVGSVHSNYNDSLIVTSGAIPQIWDLRHGTLNNNILYAQYLLPNVPGKLSYEHITKGIFKNRHRPSRGWSWESYFLPATDNVIIGGVGDTVTVWNSDGELTREIPVGMGPITALSIYNNCIIAATRKGLYRWREKDSSFSELAAFRAASGQDEFHTVSRPYGNGKFLVGSSDGRSGKASLIEGSFNEDKPLRVADKAYGWVYTIKISPKEDYAVVTYGMNGIARVDLTGDTLRYSPKLNADYVDHEHTTHCEILKDETIVGSTNFGTLYFWRKGENDSFKKSNHHHASINSISLSSDSTRMFISDRSGLITIWDTKTLEPIMDLYQTFGVNNKAAYIMITPDNYYKATPNAHKYINFCKGNTPYSFEQFDLRNNRPDIIVERLGGDPKDVELLYKAWLKRLRRSGIDQKSLSTDYHVPEVILVNRNKIPMSTRDSIVNLDVKFSDTKVNLHEISININGVPVLDCEERLISGRNARINKTLALASGQNEIVITCTNKHGASSLRETINIFKTGSQPTKPEIYVVAAGVSEYADSRYNLRFADKDANDFIATIKNSVGKHIGAVHSMLLTNKDLSISSLSKIKDFISGARRDDVVMLFFAGHGVLDSELNYYLAPHNMEFSSPSANGISYDDFISILDGNESVNRYCFIDACHSGEFDKEDYFAINTVELPKGEELIFRTGGTAIASKEEVKQVNNLIADMFNDVRWGSGATVISSASGEELAVESAELQNGLFTYCLKRGLTTNEADADKNGHISLNEWIDYSSNLVGKLSEGRQTPSMREQNRHNNFIIK